MLDMTADYHELKQLIVDTPPMPHLGAIETHDLVRIQRSRICEEIWPKLLKSEG